jgi:hypothetical protein
MRKEKFMMLNWNEFEILMDAATGHSIQTGAALKKLSESHLHDVALKRKALEKQQTIFSQASEDTIVEEYEKLRRAHRDFLSTFDEARSAFLSTDPPKSQKN